MKLAAKGIPEEPNAGRAERQKDVKSARTVHPAVGKNPTNPPQPITRQININLQGNINIENHIVVVTPAKDASAQVAVSQTAKGLKQHEKRRELHTPAGISEGKLHPRDAKMKGECREDADAKGQESEDSPHRSMPSHSPDVKQTYFAKKK